MGIKKYVVRAADVVNLVLLKTGACSLYIGKLVVSHMY
jgi:hypothetical protein